MAISFDHAERASKLRANRLPGRYTDMATRPAAGSPEPMPQIIVCGYGHVEKQLKKQKDIGASIDMVVSVISDDMRTNHQELYEAGAVDRGLDPKAEFSSYVDKNRIHCIEVEDDTHPTGVITQKQISDMFAAVAATQKAVAQKHARLKQPNRPVRMIINCALGESRSAGLCLGPIFDALKKAKHPNPAKEAVRQLMEIRKIAIPNANIVAALDQYFTAQDPSHGNALAQAVKENPVIQKNSTHCGVNPEDFGQIHTILPAKRYQASRDASARKAAPVGMALN